MACNNTRARFDDLDIDARSHLLGRGKPYLSYGIQTAHGGRLMHDMLYMFMLVSMTLIDL